MGLSTAFIGFGGNLGDVRATFIAARKALAQEDNIEVVASSKLYRTPPLGPQGQPDYLNAVVKLQTLMKPRPLLLLLQEIEHLHGRQRGERWGARTLDLDLLAWDALVLNTPELTLPHPELHRRQFVLRPLCDIAADWQHPLMHKTAMELLGSLLDDGAAALEEGTKW